MKNNNISNKEAPIIAFNIDNLLFETQPKSNIFDNLSLFFARKQVNQQFVDTVNNIWYNYPYSIYLVSKQIVSEAERTLEGIDIQATKVVHYTGIDNLRRLLNYRFYLYIDNDRDLLSQLSSKNAIHIDELQNHLRISRG